MALLQKIKGMVKTKSGRVITTLLSTGLLYSCVVAPESDKERNTRTGKNYTLEQEVKTGEIRPMTGPMDFLRRNLEQINQRKYTFDSGITIADLQIVGDCEGECQRDSDCKPTDCDHLDYCLGNDYADYTDIDNTCLTDCSCSVNECGEPVVYTNDLRCL